MGVQPSGSCGGLGGFISNEAEVMSFSSSWCVVILRLKRVDDALGCR